MFGKMMTKAVVCVFSALVLVSPADARPFLDGDYCLDAKTYPIQKLLNLPEVIQAIVNGKENLWLEYFEHKTHPLEFLKFNFKNQGVVSIQKFYGQKSGCVLYYDHWQYTKHNYNG